MKKVLLFMWGVCLFLEVVASRNNLEINIFNVGWGNFVLLKRNNNVLVIDCGKANAFKKPQDRMRLVDILSGGDNCKIVITHDHIDHYSAARVLWNCLPEVSKGNAKFFYGWFPSNEERKDGVERGGVGWASLCDNPEALDGCLGDGVSIHCIIPERENIDRHVNNLVIGIKYEDKSFIFPGDANQNWFSENSEQLQTLISKLEGGDFLLIPHHGSMSDTGFFMKNAIEHFTGDSAPTLYPPLLNNGKRLICIISSNPEKKEYYIPRQGVERLFSPWCPNKVVLHRLSLAKFDPNTRKWGVVIKNGLVSPVFSTADSVFGYKIVCNSFSFWMYNELGIPRRQEEGIAELKVFDSWGLATSRR